jgi:ParB family chromosome partitioning protein
MPNCETGDRRFAAHCIVQSIELRWQKERVMALDLADLDRAFDSFRAIGHAERAPLSMFEEDPDNPRFESMPDEFAALVENVREHGILQPIVVRRLEGGRLRIRFGARRYRAAVTLALADAPYVVTEDPRQLDDYAQVAENERRTALQPLELATFIAKKLAKGESKSAIATKLGIHPSTVTHLLCLAGDAPPFLLELYHSGSCRSPQYLYKLAKLWKVDARRVEEACAAASEVGLQLIEILEFALKNIRSEQSGGDAPSETKDRPVMPGAPLASPPPTTRQPVDRSEPGAGANLKPAPAVTEESRSCRPRLFGIVDGKDVEVLIFNRASNEGKVIVRYANELIESEVALGRLALTRLAD